MSLPEDPLQPIVARLERTGLRAPASLVLEILSPIELISSQIARFGQPFVRGTAAEALIERLGETEAWAELRRMLTQD